MKKIIFSVAVLFSALTVSAQHETRPPQGQVSITPHGKVYGEKVDVKTAHPIGDLESYLGRRTSVTTTISGKVADVDRNGDFFTIRDNKGRPVTVHFKNAGYKLPQNIRGKMVLIDGVISKQFVANNHQHYAGSNSGMEKTHQQNNNSGTYQIAARGVQVLN
ncbi:DUF4920 domain-containing protein [Mucilaginibacter arboris]|uniref:DUF4920 domain-containing protein n=1 Tax=Mucilaginibacter arboris TaxID=2682090 RepID=A0A7K1SVY7_9SPHI|nr:DUF4920 domain-containing protein [Mucilaginibacter arboris]MVN21230.1 DUF4920 domain-containing protein [Mucilaginibacter arboris]